MISIFIVRDCSCWTRFLSRYPLTGINQCNPYALSAVEVADEKENKEFKLTLANRAIRGQSKDMYNDRYLSYRITENYYQK
jgi:hypothetical protein